MKILAIDPGSEQSAFLIWDGAHIIGMDIIPNAEMLRAIREYPSFDGCDCYIEKVASMGMSVGATVFTTVFWYGRFFQEWLANFQVEPTLVERKPIKLHHCGVARANDSNIRQALIDRFGDPGKKSSPGKLYGVKSHLYAALALATYAYDKKVPL